MIDISKYINESAEQLYNEATCGYFSALPDGTIVKMNLPLMQWLGYEKSEVINKIRFQQLLTAGGRMYHDTHYAPLLRLQGSVREIQLELISNFKERIPVLINTIGIHDDKGELILTRSTVFDIRKRKQYETEVRLEKQRAEELALSLRKMNEELESFAYVVSHDLKSPLNTITSLSSYMKELIAEGDLESLSQSLEFIESSTSKLSNMIEGILHYYKSDSNYFSSISEIELQDFILDVIHHFNSDSIEWQLPSKEISIHINSSILKSIFLNLISNAIQYNDKDEIKVEITFEEIDAFYQFKIRDNGQGIPKVYMNKVFELFTTLGKPRRDKSSGTGIGLATVHKLVRAAGGTIEIESEVGVYTSFTFTIKKGID